MGYLYIKNWARHQRYARRRPTWIKYHLDLLRDVEFNELSNDSQLALLKLWLVAARDLGRIPDDPLTCKHAALLKRKPDLDALVRSGFLLREPPKDLLDFWSKLDADDAPPNGSKPKRKAKRRPTAAPRDEGLSARMKQVVDDYNEVAKTREGWAVCSKVPGGKAGQALEARVKDPYFMQHYKEALELMRGFDWMKHGKLDVLTRDDAVRKMVDGEWGGQSKPKREMTRYEREAMEEILGKQLEIE